jgi:hypothetical protein
LLAAHDLASNARRCLNTPAQHVLAVREYQIERDKDWRASAEREIVQYGPPGLPERPARHLRATWFARGEAA